MGQSSPHFATCSKVTQIYKIGLEIWGPSCQKFSSQNIIILAWFWTTLNFDLIVNESGQTRIASQKKHCKPQSLRIRLLNLVNFGPQMEPFWTICDLTVNTSEAQQDIVSWETALQTMTIAVHMYLIWWTFVHLQQKKTGPEFLDPLEIYFFGHSYLGW